MPFDRADRRRRRIERRLGSMMNLAGDRRERTPKGSADIWRWIRNEFGGAVRLIARRDAAFIAALNGPADAIRTMLERRPCVPIGIEREGVWMKGHELPVARNRVAVRMMLAFFALTHALRTRLGRGAPLGALYLATAVMPGAAAWSLRRTFVGSALIAWLASAAPRAIWHPFNLDPYSTGDAAAHLATLASTVFLPIALLTVLVRDRPPTQLAAEIAQAPGGQE